MRAMNQMPRLPPWNALIVFAAVAETRSLKVAASALQVTPGAVSQRLKALEAFVGRRLLKRERYGVSLTEDGERYAERILPAVAAIDEATRDLMEHRSAS